MYTRDKIIDAIFDAWCDSEDNAEIREKRDDVEKEINLLGLSKKERTDMRKSVSDLLCTAEERAFKSGLHLGIDMMTGRMFSEY